MRETHESQENSAGSVSWLPISSIQPGSAFDGEKAGADIRELADSIRQDGLISPITVRESGNGRYTVVSGNKRLAACRMCGMERVDAVVLPAESEQEGMQLLLREIGSGSMHYLDEAAALCHLRDDWHMTEQAIAFNLNRTEKAVHDRMRLMALDDRTREMLKSRGMPERAALALLALPNSARADVLCQDARDKLGVSGIELLAASSTRRYVAQARQGPKAVAVVRDARLYVNALRELVRQMQQSGLPAELSESETLSQVELVVRIPQKKRRMVRCHHISA